MEDNFLIEDLGEIKKRHITYRDFLIPNTKSDEVVYKEIYKTTLYLNNIGIDMHYVKQGRVLSVSYLNLNFSRRRK